ncbi:MAG: hypothetical protein Udaeo2_20860 [Candidatus Udaeobacter sp.]|nr:MAG: hypothetical protein Udaeo2_20860 [Candidatus Udaeobacter sp.]
MDTIRHSQEEQAEMLGWHIDSVVKCGLAGTFFFTWTDEWFTGGQEITDWAFGIVTRNADRKAFYMLEEKLGRNNSTLPHRPLPKAPFVSVIVCSRNGGPTLASCLDSLGKLITPSMRSFWSMTDRPTIHLTSQRNSMGALHSSKQSRFESRPQYGAAAAKGEYSPTPILTAWLIRIGSIISLALL